MLTIRAETPEDYLAVRRVNELAFIRSAEADLVDALRKTVAPYISLVATVDGQLVGHIFFSPVTVISECNRFRALGLAPMAVLPNYQNQGIGSRLVRKGLTECRTIGHNIVVVLGHPEYYPRFGFEVAREKGLRCEYEVPDEAFMVAQLENRALAGRHGLVKYAPAFSNL